MKGYKIDEGYLIVLNHEGKERTVEVDRFIDNYLCSLKGQPDESFEGILSSFVLKVRNSRIKKTELKPTLQEIRDLKRHFNLDKLHEDMYWQLAKAIVAKEGSGKYYLANTTRNIQVRDNNIMVLEGILESSDVIALDDIDGNYRHNTFPEALKAQLDIEKVVKQIKLYEHHQEYAKGNFSNLPE